MKVFKIFSVLVLFSGMVISCSAQNTSEQDEKQSVKANDEITVYYFHNARRCATCKAVEAESKKALKELYADKVHFLAFNLEDEAGETKADELDVSGQTLLIAHGDTKINITNEAFLNARNNPEKLKKIIKEKIDPLI